jgi:hypothetical protein
VPYLSSSARRSGVIAAGALLALVLAAPASASPETLRRSVSNVLFGPLDIALTPYVSAQNIYNNLQNIDDTMPVRVAYVVPGYVWNCGVQIGAGFIRVLTGVIEFLPGIGLLPFEADLDPLFAPAEKAPALVDYDTPPLHVKFGLTYTE